MRNTNSCITHKEKNQSETLISILRMKIKDFGSFSHALYVIQKCASCFVKCIIIYWMFLVFYYTLVMLCHCSNNWYTAA